MYEPSQFVPRCLPCNEAENAVYRQPTLRMYEYSFSLSIECVMRRRRDGVTFHGELFWLRANIPLKR